MNVALRRFLFSSNCVELNIAKAPIPLEKADWGLFLFSLKAKNIFP